MIVEPRQLARQPVHPSLWFMAGLMAALEALFWAAEAGFISPLFSRYHAFALFAFWDPWFEAALQRGVVTWPLLWSFLTSALLHGDWLHLALNLAAFLGLGHAITRLAGIRATLSIFAVSAIGGVLAFGLISDHPGPMVGASGAVFGYLAALTAWQERALRQAHHPRTEIWQRVLGLVLINAVLDVALGGLLAWEAHLGGFVAGWVMAYAFPPKRMRMI